MPGERYYYHFEEIDPSADVVELAETKPPASLEHYEKPPNGDARFWRRQFGNVVTSKQHKFDWLMGVFMPMICFYFDPIVFREWNDSGPGSHGLLATYQLPAYALAFVAIMAQSAWLLWGERLGSFRIVTGLILATAAVASLIIGVILFPFSVVGMFFLIGFLGFTPVLTAIVYWRNAVRAIRPLHIG